MSFYQNFGEGIRKVCLRSLDNRQILRGGIKSIGRWCGGLNRSKWVEKGFREWFDLLRYRKEVRNGEWGKRERIWSNRYQAICFWGLDEMFNKVV